MIKRTLFALAVATSIISNGENVISGNTIRENVMQEVVVVKTGLNTDEIDILAQLTMAEAEGESELGKRLVIDTVLNRIDSDDFPNDLNGVIFQKGQFSCIGNGRFKKCHATDEVRNLIREEILDRRDDRVLYFRTNRYSYGTPICKEGHHYFSGKD